jgi:hypothetical protein
MTAADFPAGKKFFIKGSAGRPTTRSGKKQFITRAEARRRAERHVLNRMFKGATVLDGAEPSWNIFGVRREDTWVVLKNDQGDRLALKSSDMVVVCKRTGRVLYDGPAQDEG